MKALDFIKGLQRPTIAWILILVIAILSSYLVIKFGDYDMAKMALIFVLGSGTTLVGSLWGERKAQANQSSQDNSENKGTK